LNSKNHDVRFGRFIYTLILIGYIFVSNQLLINIDSESQEIFKFLPFIIWSMVIFILLGILIGMDYLFKEMKMVGQWKLNKFKLIFIEIPALYYILSILIFCFNIKVLKFLVVPYIIECTSKTLYVNAAIGILLGYTLISSFYKVDTKRINLLH
jgi:hypothetical protein